MFSALVRPFIWTVLFRDVRCAETYLHLSSTLLVLGWTFCLWCNSKNCLSLFILLHNTILVPTLDFTIFLLCFDYSYYRRLWWVMIPCFPSSTKSVFNFRTSSPRFLYSESFLTRDESTTIMPPYTF